VGTFALLTNAIVSLLANVLLPFFVVPTYKINPIVHDDVGAFAPTSPIGARHRSSSLTDTPFTDSTVNNSVYNVIESFRPPSSPPTLLTRAIALLQIPGLTLRRAWLLSQLLFAICMFSTFFITTPLAATIMISFVGISWALSLWAPFALISAEVAKRDEQHRRRCRAKLDDGDLDDEGAEEDFDQAGVILGLHNVAVSSPQVLATLMSSVVFKFLQKPRNEPGDTSVSWTMRIGGLAALGAAFLASRLSDGDDD